MAYTLMPLFFFNVFNDAVTMDDEGAELVDAQAARAHAVKNARSLAAECVLHGYFIASNRIEIEDENRVVVDTVRFDEAVDLRP
ncbi:DUF6894 family protein [Allosphingosinicella deserti]|uniref:DUF6894 domain-containing protein n=1 Tax=Allosphingosinicella deserti TaxID=2116704 RepID=A0A2P7QVF8_9SPHN|nr:hypothetical protein [Sphingomonas deserti]PSJ41924.1 hypothetical protein C7I55_06580 [Sphingomonas deserti]